MLLTGLHKIMTSNNFGCLQIEFALRLELHEPVVSKQVGLCCEWSAKLTMLIELLGFIPDRKCKLYANMHFPSQLSQILVTETDCTW